MKKSMNKEIIDFELVRIIKENGKKLKTNIKSETYDKLFIETKKFYNNIDDTENLKNELDDRLCYKEYLKMERVNLQKIFKCEIIISILIFIIIYLFLYKRNYIWNLILILGCFIILIISIYIYRVKCNNNINFDIVNGICIREIEKKILN